MKLGISNTSLVLPAIAAAAIFWAVPVRAEYRAPVMPELAKMQAIPPMGRPGAPQPGQPTPAEIIAQAKNNPALAQALVRQIQTNTPPPVAEVPADPRSRKAEAPPVSPREAALESLRSKKLLEEELVRVRKMLEATEPPPTAPAPVVQAAPVETPAVNEPVVQPESINRLLSSVQTPAQQREALAARVQLVKENLARKDQVAGNLSNSVGGTLFQASLEFNRAARGSTPQQRDRSKLLALAPRRRLEKDLQDAEGIASGKPVDLPRPKKDGVLAFSPNAQPNPLVEVPEVLLLRHKPAYSDSAIKDAGAAAGGGGGADAQGASRHKSSYAGSTIDAYEGGGAAKP